jgi:hypothetical protein
VGVVLNSNATIGEVLVAFANAAAVGRETLAEGAAILVGRRAVAGAVRCLVAASAFTWRGIDRRDGRPRLLLDAEVTDGESLSAKSAWAAGAGEPSSDIPTTMPATATLACVARVITRTPRR